VKSEKKFKSALLCEMQRAIHELLHGNIKDAWILNPGIFLFSPYWIILLVDM